MDGAAQKEDPNGHWPSEATERARRYGLPKATTGGGGGSKSERQPKAQCSTTSKRCCGKKRGLAHHGSLMLSS
eukprot:5330954-Pyramimonas_sp.AAC.1